MVIEELKEKFKGKKVLVVGLGLLGGGVGVAKFFSELGAHVTVTDLKSEKILKPSIEKLKQYKIKFVLGKHDLDDFLQADIIFKGPSVKWNMPKGIPVEMEVSFFLSHCPSLTIGVTGTRGKSTTTQMINEGLKVNGYKPYLAGNLPGSSTIELLHKLTKNDIVVMELSSWQLSGFHHKKVSPNIAVWTNFYPDHLNYYKSMDEYFYDKQAIYLYQKKTDYFVVNKNLQDKLKPSPIAITKYFQPEDYPEKLNYLKGEHNIENASAAWLALQKLKINPQKTLSAINNYQGLAYRQQRVGKKNNVIFINDTTSTTPIATIKALDTFNDKPIILILGGNSKGLPTDDLIGKLKSVKKIVLLTGSFTEEIYGRLKLLYQNKLSEKYNNLEEAVKVAYDEALSLKQESCVLFSPGATSFAMFNNEFHRGEKYNEIVKDLINK